MATISNSAELLARWRAGDRKAGSLLLTSLRADIRRVIRNRLRCGAAEIDEVTQEVIETFLRKRDHIEQSPRRYAMGIVRWKLLRRFGHTRPAEPLDEPTADAPSLSVLLLRRRERGRLVQALRSLPLPDQRCLALFYAGGRSFCEIATEMELSRPKVDVRMVTARRRLHALLEQLTVPDRELDCSSDVFERWARPLLRRR